MDERTLEQTLGFAVRNGHVYADGKFVRAASTVEMMLWDLLMTPLSEWDSFEGPVQQRGTP